MAMQPAALLTDHRQASCPERRAHHQKDPGAQDILSQGRRRRQELQGPRKAKPKPQLAHSISLNTLHPAARGHVTTISANLLADDRQASRRKRHERR